MKHKLELLDPSNFPLLQKGDMNRLVRVKLNTLASRALRCNPALLAYFILTISVAM